MVRKRRFDYGVEVKLHGVFAFFIERYRFTFLVIVMMILWGLGSFLLLSLEINPEIKNYIGIVSTVYPNAAAGDVEGLVTNRIEDEVRGLDRVKRVTSVSEANVSRVVVEFEAGTDMGQGIVDIKDRVDVVQSDLPSEVQRTVVSELKFARAPIINFSLSGDVSQVVLQDEARSLRDIVKAVRGVGDVLIFGRADREFEVVMDRDKLGLLGLSLDYVLGRIRNFHLDAPAGLVEVAGELYGVRLRSKARGVEEIKRIPIRDGLLLGDVARVSLRLTSPSSLSYLLVAPDFRDRNSLSLIVSKNEGGNVIGIVDRVIEQVDRFARQNPGLRVEVTGNTADFIRRDFHNLAINALETVVLIAALLFFFVGGRMALLAASIIPMVFLAGFGIIYLLGGTINSMTLFALILSLGLIVDNAIVVVEGFHRNMVYHKLAPRAAALKAILDYRWPLIAGTLTTVAAFVPMLLVSGIVGEFLAILPKTIAATLVSSLFVSILVIPAVAAWVFGRYEIVPDYGRNWWGDLRRGWERMRLDFLGDLERGYEVFLEYYLRNAGARRRLIRYAFLALGVSLLLPITSIMRVEMFPVVDANYFFVDVTMADGTVLAETAGRIRRDLLPVLREGLRGWGVKNMLVTVGGAVNREGKRSGSGGTAENRAQITVNLVPKGERDKKSYEVSEYVRGILANFGKFRVVVNDLKSGPPTGKPIEVRIMGGDFEEMDRVAGDVMGMLDSMSGVFGVESSFVRGRGDIVFTPYPEVLSRYGLTSRDIKNYLRAMVTGLEVGKIRVVDKDAKIWLRIGGRRDFSSGRLGGYDQVFDQVIVLADGRLVPISSLGRVVWVPSLLSIDHRDGLRVVKVTAEVRKGGSASEVAKILREKLYGGSYVIPKGYVVKVGGEVEDVQRSFQDLWRAMVVAVILILVILVLQFDSFVQPLIIVYTFPLSLIGVFWGLWLIDLPISFPAFIGIVSLAGIVVNDAIILIDRINRNLDEGEEMVVAIVGAGRSRIQPIILTTLTTMFGVLPLALSNEFWRGLGFSIIFGLGFATVLTLVVVPLLYYALVGAEKMKK